MGGLVGVVLSAASASHASPVDEGEGRLPSGGSPAASDAASGPLDASPDEAMEALADEPSDVIVVTASRTARPQSDSVVATQVIGARAIAASGARNLAELLEETQGVFLERSQFGGGVRLQGLPPDYTLILVDGVRATGRVGGTLDLSRFPVEDIERVEIVKGAASALYGSDAVAGVVNVITRRSLRRWELDGRASAGRFRTLDAAVTTGVSLRDWSSRWSAGHHQSQGFDADPSDVATTVGASNQYNLSTTTTYAPSSEAEVQLSGSYLFRDRSAVDLGGGGAVFDRTNRSETARLRLAPRFALAEGQSLKLWNGIEVFRDQFRLDQREADALDELQETWDVLLQLGGQWEGEWDEHRLSVGLEGSREQLETARLITGSTSRLRGGVYLQDEYTLFEGAADGAGRTIVMPGLRLDVDSQFGGYPTPRLAIRHDVNSAVTLRASYGWGFKAPDFRELYLLFQNPSANYLVEGSTTLEPEKSQSLRAGFEWRPGRGSSLSLEGFYHRLQDRITTQLASADDAGPQRFVYRNVDAARTAGLEASLGVRPARGLLARVGYTLTDSRDGATGRPLPGQPRHQANLSTSIDVPSVGFSGSCRAALLGPAVVLQDDSGDGQTERAQTSGYASIDVRVAQRLMSGFSAFLLGENLLDAGADFSTLTPRSFSGGITFAR